MQFLFNGDATEERLVPCFRGGLAAVSVQERAAKAWR
jgi:hypothetical protein